MAFALLTACGGGGGSIDTTLTPTPAPSPTPAPTPTPAPGSTLTPTPAPTPTPTACTAAAISSTGYSLVFKGCSAANVAEYYDKTECVRENATGLIWQAQTPAGTGLRANDQYKTNFTSTTELQKESTIVNGAVVYVAPTQAEIDAVTNTVGFTNAINATNLCGTSVWRMPAKDELLSIVKANENPRIDNAWFPNTVVSSAAPYTFYYTSSPYLNLTTNVWGVDFAGGGALVLGRGNGFGLGKTLTRLVQ